MHITLTRSERAIPGTHFRPIERMSVKRFMEHEVHRTTEEGRDVIRKHPRRVSLDEIDLLLASGSEKYATASVEDNYRKDTFISGFLYVRALAAFIHEETAERYRGTDDSFASLVGRVGSGSVLDRRVRVGEGAQVGGFAELQSGVQVRDGASVGENTILRKGVIVGEQSQVGANGYVGQFARIGVGVKVGGFGLLQRSVQLRNGVEVGDQPNFGRNVYFAARAYAGDTVSVGRDGFVGADAVVGEMTTIGDSVHVGERSSIGAESAFGCHVRVAKDVYLVSPTHAEDWATIMTSNLRIGRPQSGFEE